MGGMDKMLSGPGYLIDEMLAFIFKRGVVVSRSIPNGGTVKEFRRRLEKEGISIFVITTGEYDDIMFKILKKDIGTMDDVLSKWGKR